MTNQKQYTFTGIIWLYSLKGGWHFVTLPHTLSTEIRQVNKSEEKGWGQLGVRAKIGITEWDTSIWYDTKLNSFLLPIKSEIRKKEKIGEGMTITVTIFT